MNNTNNGSTNLDNRRRCNNCGASPMDGSEFCFWHNPNVSAAAKLAARQQGGQRTRKIPHGLNPADYQPWTVESIKRLHGDLINECLVAYRDDLAGLIKSLRYVMPEAVKWLMMDEQLEQNERITRLEQRRNGQQLLPGKIEDGNVIIGDYQESD